MEKLKLIGLAILLMLMLPIKVSAANYNLYAQLMGSSIGYGVGFDSRFKSGSKLGYSNGFFMRVGLTALMGIKTNFSYWKGFHLLPNICFGCTFKKCQ